MINAFAMLLGRLAAHEFLRRRRKDNFIQEGNKLIYAGREKDNISLRTISDPLTIGSTFADGAFLTITFLILEGIFLWVAMTDTSILPFLITGLPGIAIGTRIIILSCKDWKAPLKSEEGRIVKKFTQKPKRFFDHFFGFTLPGPFIKLNSGTEVSVYGVSDKMQVGNHIRISYTPHLKYWRKIEIL